MLQREPESRFWKRLQKNEFTVCVEIDPPKGIALDRIYEQVERVMASKKVDAIDINSGAMARVGMDAMVVAGALEARGVETVPHLTTRDQNIIGLQAMLLGAWTVGGVRNVLAITGDPPSVGDYPETSGVYEVDSVGLVKILHRLNQGTDWAGKTLGGQTNFTIGVALNPVSDDLDLEIARFHAKVEAGAHFAMTQPLFDPAHWHAFLKKFGGKPPIPGDDWNLAVEQLQAGAEAEQRSSRDCDSRADAEIHGGCRALQRAIAGLKSRAKCLDGRARNSPGRI